MLSITGFGGVNEIGGNKFVLEDGKSRIMLDFGLSFSTASKYLDEFLQPRKLNGLLDYQELELLPKIKGIYRTDYQKHTNSSEPEEQLEFDALFLSHAHADHASYIHFLRSDLPIYGSEATLAVLKSIEETGAKGNLDLYTFTNSFQMGKTKDGRPKRLDSRDPGIVVPRQIRPASFQKPTQIGDFQVHSIPVNHSLPGCAAFVIKSPDGDLAYTGDLRFHGYGGHLTEEFVKRARGVKILLMEGTRIDKKETKTEEQVKTEISQIIRDTKGLVLANWPSRDTDRLWSIYNAAKENDRLLAISTKQAHLLEQLLRSGADVPKLDDPNIRIFLTRRGWGLLGSECERSEIDRDYAYVKWEARFLDHKNTVTFKDIRGDCSKYVLRADLFDMTELIDVKPPEGSSYIRSVVEPFDDEMNVSEQKLDNWLDHFGLKKFQTHCSGHAPGPDLEKIVREIEPEIVIPIHTNHPQKFKDLGFNCKFLESTKTMTF
ncbi:MBL fold metallo-hydrolase [Candidatus Micrarchaeota archaeon]|nr:MBL fold metallo-hydrolase [Candidatus Micrarchaeota archaeon]